MADLKLMGCCLMVDDVAASRNFYENFLCLEIEMNINNINVGYKGGFAIWQKEYAHNLIFGKKLISKDNSNLEIYCESSNLDETFHKAKELNLNFLHELITAPWQQRSIRVYDPDNFIIEIAESMPDVIIRLAKEGLSQEEITARTMMPAEVVAAILQAVN